MILKKPEDIEQHVLQYYNDLFATDNNCSMNVNGALGPDWFGGCFYEKYWDII